MAPRVLGGWTGRAGWSTRLNGGGHAGRPWVLVTVEVGVTVPETVPDCTSWTPVCPRRLQTMCSAIWCRRVSARFPLLIAQVFKIVRELWADFIGAQKRSVGTHTCQ